ncbi:glycosyltransferase family 2 protein [Rufibacter glacialis]|nr:glycosyltransferase family 2 protein [Rufibacter glacialis]
MTFWDQVLLGFSLLLTLNWVVVAGYVLLNSHKVPFLGDCPSVAEEQAPPVAIIVAVKDEEAELEQALTTLCQLQYSNARIIAVNDRSTDQTPQILERMVRQYPNLTVLTIQELPDGWLGKNHALYQGYLASAEEWMLFTDADVTFNAQALHKAMGYVLAHRLDHLAVLPDITSRSALFRSVMSTFALMLELRQRPWDIRKPTSKASIGIGAFNLVRRSAYEKMGTHAAFSLRPDDDLKLGERIKAAGFRQDVAYGTDEVSLEWYTSLREFVQGLMKNTFSISNYHLPTALGMALATFLVFVLPLPLLLLSGSHGLAMAGVLVTSQLLLMVFKKGIQGKWWHAFMIPVAGAIIMYILLKSAFLTIQQGGIYWRDSFYSLKDLKKQR